MLYKFKKKMWKPGAKSYIRVMSIKPSEEKRNFFWAFMD